MKIIKTIAIYIILIALFVWVEVLVYDAVRKGDCARELRDGRALEEECVVQYHYYVRK